MDGFLSCKAEQLREQRWQSFLATEPGEQQLQPLRGDSFWVCHEVFNDFDL